MLPGSPSQGQGRSLRSLRPRPADARAVTLCDAPLPGARNPPYNGLRMHLFSRSFGGTGRPIVILHGLFGSSRNWATTGRALAAWGAVSALDLRNHGDSPHSDSHTLADMVGDVREWLESRGGERPVLIGHSMGGQVAMALALRVARVGGGPRLGGHRAARLRRGPRGGAGRAFARRVAPLQPRPGRSRDGGRVADPGVRGVPCDEPRAVRRRLPMAAQRGGAPPRSRDRRGPGAPRALRRARAVPGRRPLGIRDPRGPRADPRPVPGRRDPRDRGRGPLGARERAAGLCRRGERVSPEDQR